MKAVDVVGLNVDLQSGSPLILLREQDEPHRLLPLFVGPVEAASIGIALSHTEPPRPLTHDLMMRLLEDLGAVIDHVEVTNLVDSTFVAELAIRTPSGELRLDSRPSDAIALALRADVQLFASESVLDDAGAVLITESDEEEIDEELDRFRKFLDRVDPEDFDGS